MGEMAVGDRQVGIWWLGGAGFVLKSTTGRTVAIDPYLSDSLDHTYQWKRLPGSPAPLAPSELHVDLVLATHAHEDHLDPETIPDMARHSRAMLAGPEMCAQLMREWGIPAERIVQIDRGQTRTIAGVPVTAVLAHHVSPAGAQTPDAVGYVLDLDGIMVYHTGDSLYHSQLIGVRSLHPQVLLVCINGQYGNMNPEEAARLTVELDPAVVIPMHWGLVAENTVDPGEFVTALASLAASEASTASGCRSRAVVMQPGESIVLSL
jgi:L-ascorbate 6-phosphate lactonase